MRFVGLGLTGALLFFGLVMMNATQLTRAGMPTYPPGTDTLPVVAIAEVTSLLGGDTAILPGWIEVERSDPRDDGGTLVQELAIVNLELRGASRLGLVDVTERPDQGASYHSTGEIRSTQPGIPFPASSFFELSLDLELPSTVIGPLQIHNETPIHLTPAASGQQAFLAAWPPLGLTYQWPAPAAGTPEHCIALVNEANTHTDLELCINSLTIAVAPLLPAYSVERGNADGLPPASVLALTPLAATTGAGQAPFVRIACPGLGLTGCGAEGAPRDDIDALSFGNDLAANVSYFSVGPTADGMPGTAVAEQRACPPAEPGLSPEAESDVFSSTGDGTNQLTLDGNGPIGACAAAFPLGLVESISARPNLNALTQPHADVVDANHDGVPERSVYFSLDGASPSLPAYGVLAADVLVTSAGAPPAAYATAGALGLLPGDDIDALCLHESGDGTYRATEDHVVFSLTAGSPTLAAIGAGPGDLLWPATPAGVARTPPTVALAASSLGLMTGDDVVAASCSDALTSRPASGDVNCDGQTNSIDATLVLQYHAGLLANVACAENADVDENGTVNSIDATVILQLEAGVLDQPPV